jgi:hypothetical protein
MAIKKKVQRRLVIDLTGPDGNAYVLLAHATNLARQLGLDAESICNEMKSSDYENLITVFDNHFGRYVDLER